MLMVPCSGFPPFPDPPSPRPRRVAPNATRYLEPTKKVDYLWRWVGMVAHHPRWVGLFGWGLLQCGRPCSLEKHR